MENDEAIEVEMAITPAPESNSNIDAILSLFNPFPFTKDVIENIQARRTMMSNELIFDLLLEQACIAAPHTLFPPSTPDILQALISAIALCPWDFLKKSALYFYLLSFMSPETAQRSTALPPHFAALAYACFLLDHGDLPSLRRAVALLGDARIVQDLAPKILQTLELVNEPSLVRTYVRTAQPVLQAFEDAAIYVRALLDKSLADAWVFQRGFPENSPVRNRLVRVILDACLMPTPHPKHLQHLLSLPLSPFESSLLQAYALSPPQELSPSGYTLLQDLITVRMLSSGKYSDAIKISQSFAVADNELVRKYAGTSEGKVLARAIAERKATMQDVLNVLPAIQRRELELELDESASESTVDKAVKGSDRGMDEQREKLSNSMIMSWEDLGISTVSKGASRLEGSPAPGMNASGIFNGRNVTRTPLNKMTASIFLDSPMSVSSPLRTPTRATVPPAPPPSLKPSTPLASATAPSLKSIPKPTPIISQSSTQSSTSFAESLSKVTRFDKTTGASKLRSSGRFGIEPTPTPPPPFFNSSFRSSTRRDSLEPTIGQQSKERKTSSTLLFETPKKGRPSTSNIFSSIPSAASAPPTPGPDELSLVESDDPDAFVIRRRKSYMFKSPPPPPENQPGSSSPPPEEEPATHAPSRKGDRHLPGAFGVDEAEEHPKQGRVRTRKTSIEKPTSMFKPPSQVEPHMTRSRIKIPGSLFDDDSQEDGDDGEEQHKTGHDDNEAREEDDDVAALPPTPAPKRKTRGRGSVTASTESGDDGEGSTTVRLRRSSRLSSAEPPSPQKKRPSRKMPKDSSTTRTRKRKTGDA